MPKRSDLWVIVGDQFGAGTLRRGNRGDVGTFAVVPIGGDLSLVTRNE